MQKTTQNQLNIKIKFQPRSFSRITAFKLDQKLKSN